MAHANAELYEMAEREFRRLAIAETEQEIVDSAFRNAPDDNDGDMSLEESEGWDGDALSEDEQWETTLNGYDDEHFDRPLEGRQVARQASEIEQLRQALAERNGQLDQVLNGPERQEQARQQFRDQLYERYGMLGVDDARIEALRNDLGAVVAQASAGNAEEARVNRSFAAAIDEYGRADIDDAYQALMRAGQSGDTQAVRAVYHSQNPGAALMNWRHGGGLNPDLGLGGARSHAGRSRGGGRDLAQEDNGFGNRSIEEEIAASAWED